VELHHQPPEGVNIQTRPDKRLPVFQNSDGISNLAVIPLPRVSNLPAAIPARPKPIIQRIQQEGCQSISIQRLVCFRSQTGSRVGQMNSFEKFPFLMDIDADADRKPRLRTDGFGLAQNPADLFAGNQYIVGPFDLKRGDGKSGQALGHCDG
jgi:hypothetical protein